MEGDGNKAEALCRVCGDKASGKHYGVASCDGCRGFFKRSIRRNLDYVCKESGRCVVDVTRRNQCQACRFSKCLQVNMKKDAVQHERAPRSHTAHDGSYPGSQRGRVTASLFPLEMAGASSGLCGALPPHAAAYLHHQLVYQQAAGLPFKSGVGHHFSTPSMPIGFPFPFMSPTSPRGPTYRPPDHLSQHGGRLGSSGGAKEDEVTSSEETRACRSHDQEPRESQEARDTCEIPLGLFHSSSRMPPPHSGWQYSLRPLDLTCLTLLPTENVYESAAKLLFLAVKWARSIPSFLQLSYRDQAALLEEAWSELFVLSAAQWALPVDEDSLVRGAVAPPARHAALESDARRLRETITRFVLLRVDHTEYACLKALVLFKPDSRGVRDPAHVELLQDQTHVMLNEYCAGATRHKARFGKLLLLLPSVGGLSRQSLEELFFRKTVGDVPIERLLGDMVKSASN